MDEKLKIFGSQIKQLGSDAQSLQELVDAKRAGFLTAVQSISRDQLKQELTDFMAYCQQFGDAGSEVGKHLLSAALKWWDTVDPSPLGLDAPGDDNSPVTIA